jgi:hypothetical protein
MQGIRLLCQALGGQSSTRHAPANPLTQPGPSSICPTRDTRVSPGRAAADHSSRLPPRAHRFFADLILSVALSHPFFPISASSEAARQWREGQNEMGGQSKVGEAEWGQSNVGGAERGGRGRARWEGQSEVGGAERGGSPPAAATHSLSRSFPNLFSCHHSVYPFCTCLSSKGHGTYTRLSRVFQITQRNTAH